MELRSLSPSEHDRARAMLVANQLPIDDLDDTANELFGAFDAEAMVGVVGLQRCNELGLLRSLAVDASRRSNGVGRALCDRVLEVARAHGYACVYLLTTSAAEYFEKLGFCDVERTAVPDSIRTTAQFASLCPGSARVLRLDL